MNNLEEDSQDGKGVNCEIIFLSQIKIYLEQLPQKTYWTLAEDLTSKKQANFHIKQ